MNKDQFLQSRRKFLYNLSMAGISVPLLSSFTNCNDEQSNRSAMKNKNEGKLGIALVGLGNMPAINWLQPCCRPNIVTWPELLPARLPRYRYGKKSIIITSQLPVAKWHEYINDPTLADAILDRLTANAHRIELKGESLRRKKQPKQ